jgi:hypothetical protein
MTWSRTLQLAPQKFDKMNSKYFQILSYAKQGSDLEIFFLIFCVEYFIAIILSLFPTDNSQFDGESEKNNRFVPNTVFKKNDS